MNWQLKEIITRDGIKLNGLFFVPQRLEKKAALYIHGFSGNFYNNSKILNALAEKFNKLGFGLASFNNRGHDIITYIPQRIKKKEDKFLILGAAFEQFEDCILDIETGINFLKSKGFEQIILIGISGGADKAAYYLSQFNHKLVRGVVFISPGDNILIGKKELKDKFELFLKKAMKMVNSGRGNELILKPEIDFPISYRRFISLYDKESKENVFSFNNPKAKFKVLSKIKKPILVVLGNKDKYLFSRKPELIIKILKQKAKKANKFDSLIIKGANHNFQGKEKELSTSIANWIRKL